MSPFPREPGHTRPENRGQRTGTYKVLLGVLVAEEPCMSPFPHFTNLMKSLDVHRDGVGFYTLRHVFRTVADGARDPVAIDLIMGHADPSMGGHYRERVEDSRLQAVTDHVRNWLFGPNPTDKKADTKPVDIKDSQSVQQEKKA